jgi:threonine/homoserine/homoserine lactone efflux protein
VSFLTFLFTIVGISLSGVMAPGPLTVATITKGYNDRNAGIKIALGHGIIELPIILLLYFGFAPFLSSPEVKRIIGLLGGLMLVVMGLMMFRSMGKTLEERTDLPSRSITTGMILTGANPYFLLWWATIGLALITGATEFGIYGLMAFIVVHLACDVLWEQIISMTVFRTRHLWTAKIQKIVFTVCAVVLIGFGLFYGISVFLR